MSLADAAIEGVFRNATVTVESNINPPVTIALDDKTESFIAKLLKLSVTVRKSNRTIAVIAPYGKPSEFGWILGVVLSLLFVFLFAVIVRAL